MNKQDESGPAGDGTRPTAAAGETLASGDSAESSEPAVDTGKSRGIRRLAVRGSFFELGGFGMSMVLRLGGNVFLSRLLFPAAFGLAAEVSIVLFGLAMLSDVGIRQCVIQSPRGGDRRFLDTAFTLQVARGMALTLIGVALSFPMSRWWFREPELMPFLMVGCLQLFIDGFHSTRLLTLRREMQLGWVNGLELAKQVVGMAVMISWALISPSVWALVVGSLVSAAFFTIASHFLPGAGHDRLRWDSGSAGEISKFGKWIFGSSIVSFFALQGDRAIFGRLLGAGQLGVYQIASEVSSSVTGMSYRLIGGVLYPAFSKVSRDSDVATMRRIYYQSRLALDGLLQSALGLLCGVATWVVELIWDPRYWEAGWMLRVLCVRAAVSCLVLPAEGCLTAMGMPRYGFWRSVTRAVTVCVAVPVGYHFYGVRGLVWGAALIDVPSILVLWPKFRQLGLLRLDRELLAVSFFVAWLLIGSTLEPLLPEWHLPH